MLLRNFFILLSATLLNSALIAQRSKLEKSFKSFPYLGTEMGFLGFKGDQSTIPVKSGQLVSGVNFGYSYYRVKAEICYRWGYLSYNQPSVLKPENFRAQFNGTSLQIKTNLLEIGESHSITPFASVGIGILNYSSFTDKMDESGNTYYFWADGSIRDQPQLNQYDETAKEIKRDYKYESPLAINQKALFIPVSIGFQTSLSRSLILQGKWENYFLQADNIDRNTITPQWDRIQSFTIGITYQFLRKINTNQAIKSDFVSTTPAPQVDYSQVNFDEILNGDEDLDGIPDKIDNCFGTPRNAKVDEHGCIIDADSDGIPDYKDKELDTPINTWTNKDGISLTDEEIQKNYNDSISYFSSTLRKVSKNSKPYSVVKYTSDESKLQYAKMLDEHPEWKTKEKSRKKLLPIEFKEIDINADFYLSIEELNFAANLLFDGKSKSLTPQILQNAIDYVFKEQ
jgi:hypothetical protein